MLAVTSRFIGICKYYAEFWNIYVFKVFDILWFKVLNKFVLLDLFFKLGLGSSW